MTDVALRRPVSPLESEVADLLRRYPKLERGESERLLESFRALTILELALMTSDEKLRSALDAFRRDHKRQLRPPFWHPILFLGMPASMLVALLWGLWTTAFG